MTRFGCVYLTPLLLACGSPSGDSVPSPAPPAPIDADNDGYPETRDCDDDNAAVNRGQDEVWYDGVDQDCDGRDDDQDGDGYPKAEDVNDLDASCHQDLDLEEWVEIESDADAMALCAGVCSLVIRGTVNASGLSDAADLSCLTAVSGNLDLSASSITSLDAFRRLSVVNWLVVRDNPNLASLRGVTSLTDVPRGIDVRNNESLTSLEGLESLLFAPESLSVTGNSSLSSLSGLPEVVFEAEYIRLDENALTSLQGFEEVSYLPSMSISDPVLSDISALAAVRVLDGGVSLYHLPNVNSIASLSGLVEARGGLQITSVGLSDLEPLSELSYIAEGLWISDVPLTNMRGLDRISGLESLGVDEMPSLTSFEGFGSLEELGSAAVCCNPALTSMAGFDALERVTEQFYIHLNPVLVSLQGLERFSTSGGLSIQRNDSLASLQGLSAVRSVGGYGLTVTDNRALTSLEGLEALEVVNGDVDISRNATLGSLDALTSLKRIRGGLRITRNAELSQEAARAFAEAIDVSGRVTIENNAP